ncbi:OmpA/MotB [uncultured Alphaproteobacteria bacterium]|uniref:OmpA/MotB n=1 Tax=uncultured Alphaproteobacteria bacterium TaxID=91750 RepID=A0A212J535_9PROT|nr:OmpA/MotB [uncultured Alphaproteobacteria bacterium]
MAEDGKKPIIKKVIKKGGHGHHGGAWKIAYADFMTAMMAFFLLMWLLNAVTEKQLQGIANYFAPTAVSTSTSGAGGMLGGKVIGEGVLTSNSSASFDPTLPPPTFNNGESDADVQGEMNQADIEHAQREKEEMQFEQTADELRKAVSGIPELKDLAKNLLIDNTPEGLRIQIVDQAGTAMFPSGSSRMSPQMRRLLGLVATAIKDVPKQVAIAGHTDSTKYADPNGYGNWELSADRALASRRALVEMGFPDRRVHRVVGRADADPLVADDPNNPQNRRISIVLLRDSIAAGDKERATPKSLGLTR